VTAIAEEWLKLTLKAFLEGAPILAFKGVVLAAWSPCLKDV
jgi:hypothetical protein